MWKKIETVYSLRCSQRKQNGILMKVVLYSWPGRGWGETIQICNKCKNAEWYADLWDIQVKTQTTSKPVSMLKKIIRIITVLSRGKFRCPLYSKKCFILGIHRQKTKISEVWHVSQFRKRYYSYFTKHASVRFHLGFLLRKQLEW